MIDFENWSPFLKLAFMIVPFFIGMLGVAINLQVALSKDFNVALSSITSNPYLEQMKVVWCAGNLKSRFLLMSTVGSLVTFPGLHLRRGWLDESELKGFPTALRRKLKFAFWLSLLGLFWLVVAYIVVIL
ncbi:hypothetical protein ACIPZ8_02130 [Pseudomonas sp. NPDC089422]|uniref:hypothetical protein n=1 Tax=Pseudomonas sp. NPDC089422 TaxID=3364466 RepID=UPI0038201D85